MSRVPSKNIKISNVFLSFVAVVLVVSFGFVLYLDNKEDQERYAENMRVSSRNDEERRIHTMEMEALEASDSFYQKLKDGFDVKVLIIGDSIGMGLGASDYSTSWINLLSSYLREKYFVNVDITNLSSSGNPIYGGYVKTMSLSDEFEYDLAIICYGQNDPEKDFGMYYESLIRAVRNKYDKCSIISILESSQRKYTNKIKAIQKLAEHYGFPAADTIKPFTDKNNGKYDELTNGDVNPNDKGQQIYADVISNVIDEEVTKGTPYNNSEIKAVNGGAENFNKFKELDAELFKRTDKKFIYTLNEPITGIVGINYSLIPGENSCKIIFDGKEIASTNINSKTDYSQQRILIANSKQVKASDTIEVVFNTDDEADGFESLCISWK